MYVKSCNVCQRIKVFRHKSYKKLSFLFIFKVFWKEIFMNFIIDLSSSKRDKIVYNLILVIVDKCTKMIKCLSINIKIDILKLTNVFFEKIVLYFDISADIVNNKNFFVKSTWSTIRLRLWAYIYERREVQ